MSLLPHTLCAYSSYLFYFTDPSIPYPYTLSLHDALPISLAEEAGAHQRLQQRVGEQEHHDQVEDRGHAQHEGEASHASGGEHVRSEERRVGKAGSTRRRRESRRIKET